MSHASREVSDLSQTPSAFTGILLLGGASARFGSPKALAPFRGGTLAERAHRLLAEVCDEVLAVGKAGELDGLPFPLLDDGVASRAPVHGVIAGLRRARHDMSIVLPVDVPLVTPGALRALGVAGAVPSERIPLPGGYPRELLPALEERVARGELSLRGVNETTLPLPEELLADADTPQELEAFERPGHALVVGGTGMLAGATRALAARGHVVTSLSRRGTTPDAGDPCNRLLQGEIAPVAVDYRDSRALAEELDRSRAERGPIELAVCWIHTDAPGAPHVVAEALAPGARLFQVFGTRVWPIENVPLHVAYRQVLLGSVGGRWLTNDEISEGTLEAIDADLPVRIIGSRDDVSD